MRRWATKRAVLRGLIEPAPSVTIKEALISLRTVLRGHLWPSGGVRVRPAFSRLGSPTGLRVSMGLGGLLADYNMSEDLFNMGDGRLARGGPITAL